MILGYKFREYATFVEKTRNTKYGPKFFTGILYGTIRDVNGPVRSVSVWSLSVHGLGPDRRPGPIGPIPIDRFYRSVL